MSAGGVQDAFFGGKKVLFTSLPAGPWNSPAGRLVNARVTGHADAEANSPSAGPAVTCRVAALGNAAMCRLKLDQPKRAIEACDKVLAIEKKNAKALFRKGSALRALGEFETAVEALQAASEIAPGDAGIKAELAKADKDLKKFRYGW
ncbi:hypothetical protein T484DRAFT_1781571 [Baffinella frigidus]|nr:hypothetical protein T484DRAFT_1781571 [Cryptophyta sp. CCMP2293]